jgi:hypothetical protein
MSDHETPDDVVLLELPPTHPARLPLAVRRTVVRALCHVDRLFQPHLYRRTWWLRLRDPDGPVTLVAPDYYLLRRVEAMDHLQAILNEAAQRLEEADEPEEVVPLHVWGKTIGPDSFGPRN